ncbi:MAG: hypothetical protein AVDCRST_MAG34-2499, partial [uncultured Nocardioidaceae bacterium]
GGTTARGTRRPGRAARPQSAARLRRRPAQGRGGAPHRCRRGTHRPRGARGAARGGLRRQDVRRAGSPHHRPPDVEAVHSGVASRDDACRAHRRHVVHRVVLRHGRLHPARGLEGSREAHGVLDDGIDHDRPPRGGFHFLRDHHRRLRDHGPHRHHRESLHPRGRRRCRHHGRHERGPLQGRCRPHGRLTHRAGARHGAHGRDHRQAQGHARHEPPEVARPGI